MSLIFCRRRSARSKNPTVAGLDARIEYVPEYIRQEAFAQYGVA